MIGKQQCPVPKFSLTAGASFFAPKRVSDVKKFFDELSRDSRLESAEKRFQVEVINTVLDITITELKTRFQSLRDTDEHFKCIKPKVILETNLEELSKDLSKDLVKKYDEDISDELCGQIMLLKQTFRVKLADVPTIRELAEYLLFKHAELSSSFSEVITACLLYLTLDPTCDGSKCGKKFLRSAPPQGAPSRSPPQGAPSRRPPSLKLIKTYVRRTMSQVRLSSLRILSIESQRLNDLNIEEINDIFADGKARRKPM